MAEAITGGAIVAVLRPFVRATRLLLDGLRETDPCLRARVAAVDAGDDERERPGGGSGGDLGSGRG